MEVGNRQRRWGGGGGVGGARSQDHRTKGFTSVIIIRMRIKVVLLSTNSREALSAM